MKFMIKLKYILTTFILLFSITINGQGIYCTSNSQYKIYRGRVTSAYNNSTYNSVNKNSNVMYSGSNIGYSTVNFGYRTISSSYNTVNVYQPGTTKPSPRRITVYNGNGETEQTPGGNKDSSSWLYMQDNEGNWYCSKDNGNTWLKWQEKDYSGAFWWIEYAIDVIAGNTETWSTSPTTPPENSSHWTSDPDDPFLTPVGEFPIGLLLLLMLGYLFYKINNKRTKKL